MDFLFTVPNRMRLHKRLLAVLAFNAILVSLIMIFGIYTYSHESEPVVSYARIVIPNTGEDKEAVEKPVTTSNNLTLTGGHSEKDSQHRQLTPAEVSQRFEHRRRYLNQACARYNNSSLFHPLNTSFFGITSHHRTLGEFWPVMNVSVSYCFIEKIASTTWSEIFRSIRLKMKKLGINATRRTNSTKDLKFLFVREPYHRLLSAYVDKLFSPNPVFWGLVGKYIIMNFRSNPSEHSLKCGHDVTFPEFIRYIIHSQTTGKKRDGHFVPIHDHCFMCNVSYDYIGHLETVSEDIPYLLSVMQSPVNYTTSFESHSIKDNTNWVLKILTKRIRECMPMKEACLRLWKKFQTRGIISKTEPLPVTAEQAEVISTDQFSKLAVEALGRSGPKSQRKMQQTEALTEAFASVPIEDRLELQKLLFLDFELFGFDPRPEAVFPKKLLNGNNYRYFDLTM